MKQSLGAHTYLSPLPAALVGSYDAENNPNIMTAAWIGIINSSPPMLSVSLRKERHTYDNVLLHNDFTVSLPSSEHVLAVDYVGTFSGKSEDKFKKTGLTPVASSIVHAPYAAECPLVIECRAFKHEDLGVHTIFLAEILDVKIDKAYVSADGRPDFDALNLIGYTHGNSFYYAQGDCLGVRNLWQATHLNPKFAEGEEAEALSFILEHYKKIDEGAPLEAFAQEFFWDDFSFDNNGNLVDSHEKFAACYEGMQSQLFDRKHQINKVKFEQKDDGLYAKLQVVFRAKSWQQGAPKSEAVFMQGDIFWHLQKDTETSKYRARSCQIALKA